MTLIILIFSIVTAAIPLFFRIISKLYKIKFNVASPLLPLAAGILFAVSFYLPDINISTETTTFQQHFIGGGAYSALLYLYAKQLLGKTRINWFLDALLLFAWVSTLGVANKLIEFALLKSGLMVLDTSDAYWDLLANTLGAFALYYIVLAISRVVNSIQGSRH